MFSTLNMMAIYFRLSTAYLLYEEKAKNALKKDWQISENDLPMVNHGAAVKIDTIAELNSCLNRFFNDLIFTDSLKKSQELNYPLDGKCTERVSKVILNLAERKFSNYSLNGCSLTRICFIVQTQYCNRKVADEVCTSVASTAEGRQNKKIPRP